MEARVDSQLAVRVIEEAMGRAPSAESDLRSVLYGHMLDATVHQLVETPAEYEGKSVRMTGQFKRARRGRYRLVVDSNELTLIPAVDMEAVFGFDTPLKEDDLGRREQ